MQYDKKASGLKIAKSPLLIIVCIALLISLLPAAPVVYASVYVPSSHQEFAHFQPPPTITVDGNDTDWDGIDPLTTGSGNVTNLSAVTTDSYLYMLVRGSNLNVASDFYIDSDSNNTEFNSYLWQNTAINFL